MLNYFRLLNCQIAELTLENITAKSSIRLIQKESRFANIFDNYEKEIAKLQILNSKLQRSSISKLLDESKDVSVNFNFV